MKRIALLLLVFLSFFGEMIFAQTILSGKIRDKEGKALANVNVLIRSGVNEKILSFASSDREGAYSLKLNEETGDKLIVFKRLGYSEKTIELRGLSFPLDVTLDESDVLLKEVTITPQAIRNKGDTTEYILSSFANGTEKTIEDILKKLPGIDVSEEGDIKFKGKPIEKILLDDADLFDKNYKIASKNIPANFAATVQAIEHYHENRLLKDAEYSDKIVLNLSLKPDLKLQRPVGQASVAGGYENRYSLSSTFMSMNKHLKIVDLLNFNNVNSKSSFMLDNLAEDNYVRSEVANDYISARNSGNDNVQQIENKQEANSVNFAYQPDKKLQLNGQFLFNKNRETFNDYEKTLYFDDSLLIEKSSFLKNKPETLFGNLKLRYDIKENVMLTYNGKINSDTKLTQNELFIPEPWLYKLYGKNQLQANKLELTVATEKNAAFLFNMSSLNNCNSQQFSYYRSDAPAREIDQDVNASTFRYDASFGYYKKSRQNLYYTIKSGFHSDNQKMDVAALYRDEHKDPFVHLSNSLWFVEADVTYGLKKSTFKLAALTGYEIQNIESKELQQHRDERIVFSPNISYYLKLKKHTFGLSGSYKQKNYSPEDYAGYFSDYREYKNPAQQYQYGSDLLFSALYNYFSLSMQATVFYVYTVSQNTFSSRRDVALAMDYSSPVLGRDKKTHLANLNFKKYMDALRHGIQFDMSVFQSDYNNALNSNQLRKNSILSLNSKLTLKSVFDFSLNYMAGIKVQYSSFKIDPAKSLSAYHYSIFQDILYQPNKRLNIKISFDEHFLGKDRKFYLFIKPDISYSFKKPDLTLGISAYNILNNNRIADYALSDYYSMENYYSIVPAQYLLSAQFRF